MHIFAYHIVKCYQYFPWELVDTVAALKETQCWSQIYQMVRGTTQKDGNDAP